MGDGSVTIPNPDSVDEPFSQRKPAVALLERGLVKRKPEYAAYMERTSAFFPRPARRRAAASADPGRA